MTDAAIERGLSSEEAAARLKQLGPAETTSSRSTSSIVAGNVFTLFNAIIGVFFVLVLSLGLFADAIFGLIAIINSYIGIRQELKAKRTLDELAVRGRAPGEGDPRRRQRSSCWPSEVVPGDIVEIEPGDQLVADGEVVSSRGMTLDESVLTGEADGVRKGLGDRALSGSFCVSGSGYYLVDAVREQSYAGSIAGEARTFRHPPSPLQEEVNRVILACTYLMIPLAILLIVALQVRQVGLTEAAQTATAGLITLIPEGLVLLMSVTFAVAAVRLARRGTLVQQMSGTESLAAVDTICVDKTGTLTDGELRAALGRGGEPGRPRGRPSRPGPLRRQRRRPQPHPGGDRRALPRAPGAGQRRGPLLLGVEVERPHPRRRRPRRQLRAGRPGRAGRVRGAGADPGARREAAGGDPGRAAGGGFRRGQRPAARGPGHRAAAAALAAGAGGDDREPPSRRRRDGRVHPLRGGRPEADLRRRPGDGHRGRLLGRHARRTPG